MVQIDRGDGLLAARQDLIERRGERGGGLVAIGVVALEAAHHDAIDVRRDDGEHREPRRRGGEHGGERGRGAVGVVERLAAGDHLVHDDAERVDVARRRAQPADHLLGRHVIEGADHLAGVGQIGAVDLALVHDLGDAEVEHLDEVVVGAVRLEVDVGRLEIAVDDAERVGLDQRAAHGARDREHALPRQRPAGAEPLVQALAAQQLHHDVERAVGRLAELVRGDRVRIAQPGQRGAFAAKPRDDAGIAGELGVQHLERELVAGLDVRRTIDRAETAGGDPRVDPEATVEHFTEQRIAAFDDGAIGMIWIRGHAHDLLWQGLAPRTSHHLGNHVRQPTPERGVPRMASVDANRGTVLRCRRRDHGRRCIGVRSRPCIAARRCATTAPWGARWETL